MLNSSSHKRVPQEDQVCILDMYYEFKCVKNETIPYFFPFKTFEFESAPYTTLHEAAIAGEDATVKVLLAAGADRHAKDNKVWLKKQLVIS